MNRIVKLLVLALLVNPLGAAAQEDIPEASCNPGWPTNPSSCSCRALTSTFLPTSAGSHITVYWRDNGNSGGCDCVSTSSTYDVRICVGPAAAAATVVLEAPQVGFTFRDIEVVATAGVTSGPITLRVQGPGGASTVISNLRVAPTAPVHVVLTGRLRNFGQIECGAVRNLALEDDTAFVNTTPREFGAAAGTTSPRLLVRTAVSSPAFDPPTGIVGVSVQRLNASLVQQWNFAPSVRVENGEIRNWEFPDNWAVTSPTFEVSNATLGVVTNFAVGGFGRNDSDPAKRRSVDAQVSRAARVRATKLGFNGTLRFNTAQSLSAGLAAIGVENGLVNGTLGVGSVESGLVFDALNGVNADAGLNAGAVLQVRSLTSTGSLRFPFTGLRGQVIINDDNSGGTWAGTVSYSTVEGPNNAQAVATLAPDAAGVYNVPSSQVGGGAVGLVPFQLYTADCVPAPLAANLSGGMPLDVFVAGASTGTVRVRFFGPVKPAASNPPAQTTGKVNSVFTIERFGYDVNNVGSWTDVTESFDQFIPGTQGGREVTLLLKPTLTALEREPFAIATSYRVLPRSGTLFCDRLRTTALVPVGFPSGVFEFRTGCFPGGQPSPADVTGGTVNINGQFPDGTVDGSDFIAFINSFSIGDATVDPTADVSHDGTIDGGDFILFINAFSVGC